MANGQEMDQVLNCVKHLNDAIIANTKTVAVAASQPVVRKSGQVQTHFINFGFDARPDGSGKAKERCVEARVVDLRGRAHRGRQGLRTRGRRPVFISRSDS